MKDPLKPRDKITQKMTRDGAIAENQTTGDTERISNRIRDADLQKTPEQQAAQDAMQLPPVSDTSPLPHVPGAAPKADTGKTERVMEHIEAAHTRKASKKAVRKAQAEATAGTKSSRLQFTDEERAAPELEKYIKKSDKAADRLDKAKAAIPKEKKLVKERTFDETTGKGKTRLHFEEKDKPPGFKEKHNPLSRPTQEAGILVHNKIHSVEKDNSGVEGAHKSEEAAERGLKYGARKIKQGYPYWSWYGFNSRVEWCACFVSWCYGQMGLSEPRFAACQSQGIPWFTSHGQWGARGYENIAPGDAIFFDWDLDGSADHVGLVIGRDESRVYTVEGNSGDACKIKSYPLDYACIKGYGLMNWN